MGLALCPGGFFATCATRSDSKTTLQPNKLCSHAKRSQWQISKLKPNMAEEAQVISFEIIMDTKIKPSAVGEHAGYENLAGLLENVLLDFLESDDSTYLTNDTWTQNSLMGLDTGLIAILKLELYLLS